MKKLSLNKKIVSNLNSQDMNDVKGGALSWPDFFLATAFYAIGKIEHWIETNARCLSDECTKFCISINVDYTCQPCSDDCPPC